MKLFGQYGKIDAWLCDLSCWLGWHPAIMRDKIINLKPTQQGYNYFGELEPAKYYDRSLSSSL